MGGTEIYIPPVLHEKRPLLAMEVADGDRRVYRGDWKLVHRFRRWTEQAHWQLLSQHKGHIVKRTSNGLTMEFVDARSCLRAAFALNQLADSGYLQLRAVGHLANYSRTQDALFGRDVELLSELVALAAPNEVLVTAELHRQLMGSYDADFEDLGHRRLAATSQSVRLFRAHSGPGDTSDRLIAASRDLRPGLAIIPLKCRSWERKHRMLGELIADGVIGRLSHSVGLRVISRHSTSALQDSRELREIERHLCATFVLSGDFSIRDRELVVTAELAEARSHRLLWSGQLRRALDDLFQEDSELLNELARTIAHVLDKAEVRKPSARRLPDLDSNAVLLSGISMTHSDSAKTFERGHEVLTGLVGRHPKVALPRAWLGIWHAMNVIKGTSNDVAADTQQASQHTQRALDAEPENAMALAVEGYIQCQLLGNPQQARSSLNSAIEADPSEPMTWLFKSFSSAMWGSSSASVTEAYLARSLSPVDPLRYFFDLLTGNALLADRQLEQAITCARKSLRANKHHVPTLRLLLTAQAELGQMDEARQTLTHLLAEVPELTLSSYLSMGSTDSPLRQRTVKALRELGLPAG
jgi:TolB-like protein